MVAAAQTRDLKLSIYFATGAEVTFVVEKFPAPISQDCIASIPLTPNTKSTKLVKRVLELAVRSVLLAVQVPETNAYHVVLATAIKRSFVPAPVSSA